MFVCVSYVGLGFVGYRHLLDVVFVAVALLCRCLPADLVVWYVNSVVNVHYTFAPSLLLFGVLLCCWLGFVVCCCVWYDYLVVCLGM